MNFPTPPMFMLTLLSLATPLIMAMFLSKTWLILKTKTAVKTAFFLSLVPLLNSLQGQEHMMSLMTVTTASSFTFHLLFIHDLYSSMFIPIALFVSWAILDYSDWYMAEDPHIHKFFKYLLIFLMAMMILVTSGSLFQLFIGWEGVGTMSFLLIGWYRGREETLSSSLMAIIYNRMGDIGLLICMTWFVVTTHSLNFTPFSVSNPAPLILPLTIILAAAGKSAQFGFHPWLPAAMEGPTPVSALLHSSTMVIAGVFLLIRMHPLLATNPLAMSICLCLGAITTFFSSLCALPQNDLKKIIAYSTSSQLGLMIVMIGLNLPKLAFLHICMHAFFKAMLFMCAGFIIHSLNNEQDIRKMGGLHKCLPITSACFSIGNLALMGMPYLTGFFSKDTIIEVMSTSYLNAGALLMTLMATTFTAVYTLRIILLMQTGHPQHLPTTTLHENIPTIMNPITRLATGSIVAGALIVMNTLELKTPTTTMPMWIKMAALTVTIIGLLVGLKLVSIANKMPMKPSDTHNFTNSAAYFDPLVHRELPKKCLEESQKAASHLTDQSWYMKIGPKVLAKWQKTPVRFIHKMQKGLIKIYLASFLIMVVLLIIAATLM